MLHGHFNSFLQAPSDDNLEASPPGAANKQVWNRQAEFSGLWIDSLKLTCETQERNSVVSCDLSCLHSVPISEFLLLKAELLICIDFL